MMTRVSPPLQAMTNATSARFAPIASPVDMHSWNVPFGLPSVVLSVYSDVGIPTLEEAIHIIHTNSIPLIEYKRAQKQSVMDSQSHAKSLMVFLQEKKILDQVVVQSFDPNFLQECRRLSEDIVLGLLLTQQPKNKRFLMLLEQIKPEVVGWQ